MTESSQTYAESEDLLAIRDTAALLGVSIATVRRYANDGRLPVVRTLGGQRRFRRADVEAARGASRGDVVNSETTDLPGVTR